MFGETVSGRAVRQPRGHVVGIVGFGAIGKVIGQRLSSIGMKVHYTKTSVLSKSEKAALGYNATFHESAADLFKVSDLLVLACPLNSATKNLVNEESIKLLPQDARIVNIGRGGLIDTKALVRALRSGRISGAGLDVFEREPIIDDELCDRWDVVLLPHIGSATMETAELSEINCMNNINNIIFGDGKDLTSVN